MKLLQVIFVIIAASCLNIATAQDDPAAVPTLDDFLGEADFWGPELSPSGRYLSGVLRKGDDSIFAIFDLDSTDPSPQFQSMGDVYLNWVEWVSDDRLLLSVTGYINLRRGESMSREDLKELGRRDVPVAYTRLIALDRDGGNSVVMFANDKWLNRNLKLSNVVSFLPGDPDHILMSARRGGDLDLYRLNVLNGSFERIANGTEQTFAWFVDRDGEPAFRFNANKRGTVIYIFAREDRTNGKIKWRKVRTIRLRRNKTIEEATEFRPLYPGPTETTYYVAARPDGEDKIGIYLYDFEEYEFIETIRSHPDVDIYGAIYNRENRELQGVSYYEDRLVFEFFDRGIQRHLDGLDAFFGHQLNVRPIMSNQDGTRWLIHTTGPTDAGTYHIYYVDLTRSRNIASNMVSLFEKALGETQIVKFEARDGLALSGYLTRPPQATSDDRPPLIMMPHGGPELRDIITFDYMVQILVAHGYQVFQPNFRGSSGFGKAFADLGRRQWGADMQTDVDDALAHLVEAGLVDADRACILGASYGGYVALAAAALTPEQYQCAVAIAAPSDLVAQVKWDGKQEGRQSETYKYWVEHIGDPRKDKDAMDSVSPAKLADKISQPILLIHGAYDDNVPIKQSKIMAAALKKAGKPYAFVELEDSGHSYRSEEDERKEYEEILAFLAEHLPVVSDHDSVLPSAP